MGKRNVGMDAVISVSKNKVVNVIIGTTAVAPIKPLPDDRSKIIVVKV